MKNKLKLILLTGMFLLTATSLIGQQKPVVLRMQIDQEIDPRMNRYTTLAFEKADEINADYVIIEMDTYGGALNDADDIRTRILNYEKPVYVWINKDAASAGALISIACDSIYMAQGASIGAATVVVADGTAAPDKYQSYMRSIMRSTAEAKGRNPKIAEAMVDQNIEVDSVSNLGQVVTFSTSEAIKNGFCEAEASSIDEIMLRSGIEDYELVDFELSNVEKIIALFLNPFVSGILILIIVGGLYFELQTPGVGFPILASAVALVLYFTPYYLNGLADHWEIIIFFIGVILILIEIFVLPGFGIPGILGIIFTIGALMMVMVNNDAFDFSFVAADDLLLAFMTTIAGLLGAVILMFVGGVRLTNTEVFKRIALQDTQDRSQGYVTNYKGESFIGKIGTTYTVLRPSGKVMIDDTIYDAVARGNFIDREVEIEVIGEEGTSLKVKERKA